MISYRLRISGGAKDLLLQLWKRNAAIQSVAAVSLTIEATVLRYEVLVGPQVH